MSTDSSRVANLGQEPSRLHGIFNVNKPYGITSHDVVNVVRKASGVRRVGHAGTLDPAAEGVLLICVGKATRISEFLVGSRKTYCAEITFGTETNTYDAEGEITFQAPEVQVQALRREDVEKALQGLTGQILQVPPMFSAIKRRGQPLHKLARAGKEIELEPRKVEIYSARIVQWQTPVARIEIECSKGTYIRSFAHDLGARLGCGAYLSHLVRLASGRFTLDDAVPLDVLAEALRQGYWEEIIYALDYALLDYAAAVVGPQNEKAIASGQPWLPRVAPSKTAVRESHGFCRAYSLEGEIIALLKLDRETNRWQPEKVFV